MGKLDTVLMPGVQGSWKVITDSQSDKWDTCRFGYSAVA